MNKAYRLTRQADFRRLQRSGRTWSDHLLTIRATANLSSSSRFAFSIGKNAGKAVVRNKTRRRLREILRGVQIKQGWDVLIIVRPAFVEAGFEEMRATLLRLLRRAGMLE